MIYLIEKEINLLSLLELILEGEKSIYQSTTIPISEIKASIEEDYGF